MTAAISTAKPVPIMTQLYEKAAVRFTGESKTMDVVLSLLEPAPVHPVNEYMKDLGLAASSTVVPCGAKIVLDGASPVSPFVAPAE